MPKRKAENTLEGKKNEEQNKSERLSDQAKNEERDTTEAKPNDVDIEKRAEELSNRVLRTLYATYGAKDSHTNKHLYYRVIFEVSLLSNKTIEEVMQKWPKFDIFSISKDIKKVVREELENDQSIIYRMVTNDRIIADRLLAKVIAKNLAQ